MRRGRSATPIGAILAAWALAAPAAADAPAVVASIKPVHALAAAIMDGVGTPALLIEGGGSPHAYSLRPSEAERLQRADVVLWIGPELETFLAKALHSLTANATVVALHDVEGMRLLPLRDGGLWAAHDHGDDDEHGHDAHDPSEPGTADMHMWLDPANGRAMAAGIVAALSAADPAHQARYAANGARLDERLARLDTELATALAPIADRPYVVFHDAYQYFEHRYRLSPVGSITLDPDLKPSARRLAEMRAAIREREAVCVFSEPQFEPAAVATLIEGTGARPGVLDPLGATVAAGADAYPLLLQNLATALIGCLTPDA